MRAVCGKGRVMAWVKSPNSWTESYTPERALEATMILIGNVQNGPDPVSPYCNVRFSLVSKLGEVPMRCEIQFNEWIKVNDENDILCGV